MNYEEVFNQLERGEVRAAYQDDQGEWHANVQVKEAILSAFRQGELKEMPAPFEGAVDKHNLVPQNFTPDRGVRLVPGGSSVRRGAYVSPGVIIMPPSYINIGAYVDEGTMVDSHALVGSCAQIGKNVHLSAGVQIGGVLEPIGMSPVIIEDNAFLSAMVSVVEGIRVGRGAVLAPGVNLSRGVTVYDCVNEKILPSGSAIPPMAVVVPGSRPLSQNKTWGREMDLRQSCALIIKYRDEKSDAALTLEEALR